ncbi:MAG: SdpI family protein [Burkholderiales bacterium]|nr:SdpI family protein [Burkholderiales bacterium]
MSVCEKGLVTVNACAFVGALAAVPLALRRIPRNRVYGFRIRATLADDDAWYGADAYFGRSTFAACAAGAIVVLDRSGAPAGRSPDASIAALVAPAMFAVLAMPRRLRATNRGPVCRLRRDERRQGVRARPVRLRRAARPSRIAH